MPTTPTPTAVLALGSHTELAELLNAAMASDEIARAAYRLVWGCDWEPLPLNGYETTPAMTAGRAARAELSTCR